MDEDENERLKRVIKMPSSGRTRFFEVARVYAFDEEALDAAREFVEFKLRVVTHAREEILMVINRGVTTYQQVRDPETGEPTGISRETQDLVELTRLRMWLDLFLFELVGIEDALLQAVNVAFNFNESSKDMQLAQKLHGAVRNELQSTLKLPPPARDATGLHKWRQPGPDGLEWLEELRELRRQATHRHLVGMVEQKAWEGQRITAPIAPAKLRSEFRVDLGGGHEESLDSFVALGVERVVNLLNCSCDRLAAILGMLIQHHGGRVAAARRRAWHRSRPDGACLHPVVEPGRDDDGGLVDRDGSTIYFCSDCGTRVLGPIGRKGPEGGTYWSASATSRWTVSPTECVEPANPLARPAADADVGRTRPL